MLYDFYQWHVHASNSKKHLEVWQAIIQHQRANRERFYYKRTRFFTETDSESNEEHWMAYDEYENQEAYDRMQKAIEKQPDLPYSNDHSNNRLPILLTSYRRPLSCVINRLSFGNVRR